MYIQELRKQAPTFPLILVRPTLILSNSINEILLVKHCDGTWGLPGGLLEPGESVEQSIKRELLEELDIKIKDLAFYHVFSGEGFSSNSGLGAESHYVAITYSSTSYAGTIKIDGVEVIDYGYFSLDNVPETTISMIKEILKHYKNLVKGSSVS